jgi:ribosomal protein S20
VANRKASKKAILQSQKRAIENGIVCSKLKTRVKKIRIGGTNSDSIWQVAIEYVSVFDKAAKRNIIHSNSANRRKSSVSRSRTFSYKAVWQVTKYGSGQSTCVGIGGDQIIGITHLDGIKMFSEDPDPKSIIMRGEIGGNSEEVAAADIKQHVKNLLPDSLLG